VASSAAPARATKPRTSSGLDGARVRAQALSILAELAQTRELPLTREVHVDVIDRPGIRGFAKSSLYEDTTPEELLLLGKIEASLGILPPDADPETVLLDMLEEGVLGFYDPKRRTLFVGDFVPRPMLSMVVGHEIAHGLQDMHFDLERHQEPLRNRADAESARRFLIEGEAQATYLAWVSGDVGLAAIDDSVWQAMGDQVLELSGVSPYPILARSLQMPYADGTATIARLVLARGWAAVTELYTRLPETTEQMLHLDKLLAREPAIELTLAAEGLETLLAKPSIWRDQVGEATWLAMLAEVESASVARRCAAGWGGDTLLAFHQGELRDGLPTVVVASHWDSDEDARDFERCTRRYVEKVIDPATSLLERRGRSVLLATQIPETTDRVALAKAAWQGLRVGSAGGTG